MYINENLYQILSDSFNRKNILQLSFNSKIFNMPQLSAALDNADVFSHFLFITDLSIYIIFTIEKK